MVKNGQKIALFGYFFDFFGQNDENRILPVVGSISRGQKGPVPAIISPFPVQARRSSGGPNRYNWPKIAPKMTKIAIFWPKFRDLGHPKTAVPEPEVG